MTQDVVIASTVRTAFGKFCGTLRETPTYELGAFVIKEALNKTGIQKDQVDEVFMGCAIHGANDDFVSPIAARQSLLKAGLPPQTKSVTIDKACCSSMTATHMAFNSIRYYESEIVVVVGAENFSRVPFTIHPSVRLGQGSKLGNPKIKVKDPLFGMEYKYYNPVAVDAGKVALEHGATREDQDLWAFMSQQRYKEAKKAGKYKDEIVPMTVSLDGQKVLFEEDEFPKPYTTLEKLKKLTTVFGSPTVTAGNAPGLNDGASGMILMSSERADRMGIMPIARVIDTVSICDLPQNIAVVPALAIEQILK